MYNVTIHPVLVRYNAAKFGKCTCCGESIRHSEPRLQGFEMNKTQTKWKQTPRSTYCIGCLPHALQNLDVHPDDIMDRMPTVADAVEWTRQAIADANESRSERMREAYPAYSRKEDFWRDCDAGHFG